MPRGSREHKSRSRGLTGKNDGELRQWVMEKVNAFAAMTGWAPSTIGLYLIGNPKLYEKLVRGGLQIGTADLLLGRMREAVEYKHKHGRWPDAQS